MIIVVYSTACQIISFERLVVIKRIILYLQRCCTYCLLVNDAMMRMLVLLSNLLVEFRNQSCSFVHFTQYFAISCESLAGKLKLSASQTRPASQSLRNVALKGIMVDIFTVNFGKNGYLGCQDRAERTSRR